MNTGNTLNILIVEDEGDICLILNLMLKQDNVEIEHVNSLAKAGLYLKEHTPAVVIMDNHLPDGFGITYIKEIKATYPDLKIIMITGNTDIADKETALQNGASVFLSKPFTKEQIKKSLEEVSGYQFV